MKTPRNYIPSKRRKINGCWNCEHRFEDFDLYCFLTCESAETLEEGLSFISMFYCEEMGICDDWEEKKDG